MVTKELTSGLSEEDPPLLREGLQKPLSAACFLQCCFPRLATKKNLLRSCSEQAGHYPRWDSAHSGGEGGKGREGGKEQT